jgi:hypothetical protein
MSTLQIVELTAPTDASGYITFLFDNDIDKIMVTPNQPQAGTGQGIIGASAVVTSNRQVKIRCWEMGPNGVRTCQNKQVTVTLQGVLG